MASIRLNKNTKTIKVVNRRESPVIIKRSGKPGPKGDDGAVDSVNGQIGVVVLDADDVGAVDKTGDTMEGEFTNSAPLTQVLFNGSAAGNNSEGQPITNTSPRLELGTHQYSEYRSMEAQKGGYSELIRLTNLSPLAKATMAWYDHDYNPTAWIVSHFQPQDLRSYPNLASFPVTGVDDGLRAYFAEDTELYYTWNGSAYIALLPTNSQYYFRAIHQHVSTETSDSTRTALYSRLAIPYGLDVVPITTSNAHFRITGGTNNGVEAGAFVVDNGKMFSLNPIILYPNSANAATVETWKDDPTDNIFANNTEGLRIRVLASGNADNLVSGQRMVSLNAEGVSFMGIAENLILGGATAVSMGINRSAGVTLDVRRDLGITSATHVISRLSRSESDGFMNFGYIANGTTLQSFVINPTSNKNLVIALTGLPSALFIANTTGNIGVGTSAPTHSITLPSTATGIALYNTVDQTTNFERGRLYWNANVLTLDTGIGGTGTPRNLSLGAGNVAQVISPSATANIGVYRFSLTTGVANAANTSISGTLSASSASQTGLLIIPTINQTSTAGYTALLINPTETTTGSGAKLLADFQVGGVSRLSIKNDGVLFPRQATTAGAPTYVLGGVYFDTTLNKLRIGGAAGWETVTSV